MTDVYTEYGYVYSTKEPQHIFNIPVYVKEPSINSKNTTFKKLADCDFAFIVENSAQIKTSLKGVKREYKVHDTCSWIIENNSFEILKESFVERIYNNIIDVIEDLEKIKDELSFTMHFSETITPVIIEEELSKEEYEEAQRLHKYASIRPNIHIYSSMFNNGSQLYLNKVKSEFSTLEKISLSTGHGLTTTNVKTINIEQKDLASEAAFLEFIEKNKEKFMSINLKDFGIETES